MTTIYHAAAIILVIGLLLLAVCIIQLMAIRYLIHRLAFMKRDYSKKSFECNYHRTRQIAIQNELDRLTKGTH